MFSIFLVFTAVVYNVALIFAIRKRKISYRQRNHDRFLKRKELEYVLEISDSWRKQSFFLYSSFKGTKARMYFRPVYNLWVLYFIACHAYLGSEMYTKAVCFSIGMTIGALFMLAVRPFRCASTNFLVSFQLLHLCGPLYMVMQVVSGMEHGLLVNTYFSTSLYIMLSIFGGIQLVIIILCLIFKAKWPMNEKVVRNAVYRHERILEMMQQAFTVITKLRLKK